jgi:hypothetical protein
MNLAGGSQLLTFTYGLTATTIKNLWTNATQMDTQQLLKAYRILLHAPAFKVGTNRRIWRC